MLTEVVEHLSKEYNWDVEVYEDEEFRDIIVDSIDYTGIYQVSNYGRVWSIKRQSFLKEGRSSNGYLHVTLCKNKIHKTYSIHKLVLTAFKRPKKWFEECRHLDRDRQNNHIDNLEWGSNCDNYKDRIRHGTDNKRNEDHHMAILTNEQVIEIRDKYKTGKYSQRDLAKEYSVTQVNIWYIVNYITFEDI